MARPKEPHRGLDVARREEQVAGFAVAGESQIVPRTARFSEAGERADVERIKEEFLGLEAECGSNRGEPTRDGLPGQAVDQVEVQNREGETPDSLDGGHDSGGVLRPARSPHFRFRETLNAEAHPRDAPLSQHGESFPVGGAGRRFDRGRNRRGLAFHQPFRAVEQSLELLGIEERRRPTADRKPGEAGFADRSPNRDALAIECIEIVGHHRGGRTRLREEIAEPTPHVAERNVDVQEEPGLRLRRPRLGERDGRIEPAVRRLVRVGVGVPPVRRAGEQ